MPDLVKKWREQHPYLSALEDEINADYNSQKYQQEKQNEQYEQQRKEYEQWVEANQYGPYGDERDRAAPRGVSNALTPEMEARRQAAAGVNRAPNAYQTAMMQAMNAQPRQEETRSTDELRRDMNRQNRNARGTERMAADMAGQGLRDQSLLFDPTYTSNLRTMGQTMEAQQNKAAAATNLYQTLSVQRREQEEREKYSSLMSNPDFAAKSQGDPAIGRKVSATSLSPAERLYQSIYNHGGEKTNAKDRNAAEFVSDEEAGIFFYLWNTQGPRAAQSYYNDYVDNRASQRRAEEAQRQAEAFGHYDVIGSSAESVVANFASGVGLVDMAWQNIARSIGLTDKNKPLNYYSSAQLPGLVSDAIRKGAADELAEMFPKLKIGKGENAVNVASFLYETGMSMADSGVAVLLNTIGIPEAATLANMGAAAGTRAIRDARERGATDGQALAFGFSSAIMEALFEKISLDRILEPSYAQTAKAHFLNALKQSFTEGSEEVMTTLANTAMDQLIMGDKSELFTRQRQLMEQGVSEKEALSAAFKQWGTGIVGDLLGGMISGFGMGGAKEVGTGLGIFAQGVRQDMQTARALTDYQNAQQAALQITQQQPPAAPVQQRQLTAREQNPLRFAMNKAQNGETVTGNDAKAILNDPQAMQTLRAAGVLTETIRPGAEGRAQIQQAVMDLAEQTRAEMPETQQATERTSQLPVQNQQETAQERTAPPLPRQMAQEQQERVTTPPVPQNTQEAAQEPTLRLRAQEEQAPRQETLRIRENEVAEPTQQAPLTIRGANATVEENRQEESYGQGQQTETAAAAGEDDFRARAETAAEGARRSYLDRIERSSGLGRVLQDLRNYRLVRGAESRASEVSRIRNQAEAGNQREVSAQDYGLANGTADKTAVEIDNATLGRVLGRGWTRAVDELARQGVTLKGITGQLWKADGPPARAFFSGDGKTIVVQVDNPRLSWNQLLDHEDLHRRIKENPAYRKAVEDALLADKKLQAYLPEIIDRYSRAYAEHAPDLTSDDVIEELLADYRAGFDMLDPLGMNTITARAAKRAAKDIKSAEKTLRKQVEEQRPVSVDDEAKASREFDSDYLAAVERGDMETAQKMVDEAAKAAGYRVEKYHGTKANFNTFNPDYARHGASGFGYYFGDKEIADEFGEGGRVFRVLINDSNIGTQKSHNITVDGFESAFKELGLSPENTYQYLGSDTAAEYVKAHHDYRLATDLQYWAVDPERFAEDPKAKEKTPREIISILKDNLGLDGIKRDNFGKEVVLWDNTLMKLADPVTYDDNGNVIPLSQRFNTENEDIRYSIETDPDTLKMLNSQPTVTVYRAMQLVDGKLYPPMAAKVSEDGGKAQWVEPTEFDTWYRSDEHPELIDAKGKFKLDKGNGKSLTAAYNPYFHTSNMMLNDQFSSAWDRDNLVVVEASIPKSELTSGYRAQGAKDPVGEMNWHSGPVASKLKGDKARRVTLSRWVKINRIVPNAEVAQSIAKLLDGENISVPENTVTPSLKAELEKLGVPISPATGNAAKSRASIEIDPEVAAQFSPEAIARRQSNRTKGVKGERKVSRVRSNTYEYSGLYNEVEAQMDEADEENYTYDPISEKKSMNEALGRLKADFDGEASRLSEADKQWGGSDLDTAMGILHRYRTEGRATGDYSRFWDWSKTIQEKGTKGGQFIQAFAKYTRTGTGAAMKGAKDIHDRFKLNPAQQKQVDAAKKKLMDGIDGDMNGAAQDAMKQAKGQKEPGKKQDGKVDKKKLDAEVQRRKDAERLVREISKLFEKQQDHGEPVENWLNLTGEELARKIAGRFSEPKQRTKTTMQTILSDLVGFAEEHALPDRKKAEGTKRTAIDIITDYLNNRDAYGTAWAAAQSYLRAAYTDDQEKLDALNSFLTATIAYNAEGTDRTMLDAILQSADVLGISEKRILELTSAGATASTIDRIGDELVKQVKERMGADYDESFTQQLKDAVRRHITGIALQESTEEQRLRLGGMTTDAARQLEINLQKLLTQSRGDKNRAAQSVADYLIRELDIPSSDAAIAADRITSAFMDELANRADRRLQQMFAEKKPKTQEQRDKLLDLIRLGGLTNSNVEDAVVDALGIGGMSRERQRELVADMARFGETLDAMEDDDAEGLRQLIREQAAARGTRLSRLSEKTLSGETDIEYLRDFALAQLASIAGDFENRSAGEMISTYQTISHLLNMRTALRNVTSNQVFDLIDSAANNVSMLPDMVLGLMTGKRTVGLNKSWASQQKRQGAIQGARRNALEVNLDVGVDDRQKSKYGTAGRRTWNMANSRTVGKILSHLEEAMGYELNTTDEFHKGSVMGETLESLARFVDRGDMTLEEAQEFAKEMALYRSFQDDSLIGTMLSSIKDALNLAGVGEQNGKQLKGKKVHDFGLGDFVTKYTQVPGALVHRAIEFSPLGYAKALFNLGQLANARRQGYETNAAQRKAALAIGRATTGTGLITLFAALAKAGLLRRDDDEDKNAKAAHQAQGLNGTQLNLTALGRWINGESTKPEDGDILIDINFLEPLDALMGLATLVANDDERNLESIWNDSITAVWDSISSLSMMQTLRDAYNVYQYYDDKAEDKMPLMNQMLLEIASSSLSGFIPSPVRQLAQATDMTYRDQYRSKKISDQMRDKAKNSIPGLRQTLAPKITPLGEDKKYEKPLLNYLNATLNPGNISVYKSNKIVSELERVYDETENANIWPERNAPYSFKAGDEKYTLTPDERTQYQRTRGQETAKFIEAVMGANWYKAMSPDSQAKILNDVGNFANYIAKKEMLDARGVEYASDDYQKLLDMYLGGATPADVMKEANKKLAGLMDAGLTEDQAKEAKGLKTDEFREYIKDQDLSDEDKLSAMAAVLGTEMTTPTGKPTQWAQLNNAVNGGLSVDRAIELVQSNLLDDYTKYADAGLTSKTSDTIVTAISKLKPEKGYDDVRDVQKWNAIINTVNDKASQEKALKAVMKNSQWASFQEVKSADVSAATYVKFKYDTRDYSSTRDETTGKEIKGQTKKDKIMSYIDGLNIPDAQKDALYLVDYAESGLKDTPWHKGGGKGSGSYAMARTPALRLPDIPKAAKPSSGLRLPATNAAPRQSSGLRLK